MIPNQIHISHLYRKGMQYLLSAKGKYFLTVSCFICFATTAGAGTDFHSMKPQTEVELREA